MSIKSEKYVWHIDGDGLDISENSRLSQDELSLFSYSRNIENQNMLIFIIEDVAISENIYSDATWAYVHIVVEQAKYYIIGLGGVLVFVNFLVVFLLIYIIVVIPVTELTDQIMKP
jgi:hypothetical protein